MKVFSLFVFSLVVVINTCFAKPSPDNSPVSYGSNPRYNSEPASYNYQWSVEDGNSNNNYGQTESRNGDKTTGSYFVLLPDGRTQIVTYTVDKNGGYVADITYEGEAKYPDTPKYRPATSYPGAQKY